VSLVDVSDFFLLTDGASFDVILYPSACAGPIVFAVNPSDCFVSAQMAGRGSVMPYLHESTFEGVVWWDD